MRSIVHTPNQVLITKTKEVVKVDRKILEIIQDMKEALISADNPKGVGLAAPQIGVNLRIFLMRPEEDGLATVYINPKIIAKSKSITQGIPGKDNKLEGCLSIPKIWGVVKRNTWIKLDYLDENGQHQTAEFKDFPAIIVQHEIDHLEGILFPRRIIEQKGKLYKSTFDEKGKEILEPLEL